MATSSPGPRPTPLEEVLRGWPAAVPPVGEEKTVAGGGASSSLDEYVHDALRAGASGFLLKDVPPEQLVAGIWAVADGGSLLAPAVTRRLIESFLRDRPPDAVAPPGLDELTDREREVLTLIARGPRHPGRIHHGPQGSWNSAGSFVKPAVTAASWLGEPISPS